MLILSNIFLTNNLQGYAPTLAYYSGFSLSDLSTMVQKLLAMMQKPAKENLKTVRSKYNHKVFHEVAATPVPTVVDMTSDD
jgi:hypothetical protein